MEHIQIQTTVEGMLFKLFGPGMLIEKLDLAIVRGACGRSMGYSPHKYVNHFLDLIDRKSTGFKHLMTGQFLEQHCGRVSH
jgi:hypothetical protein